MVCHAAVVHVLPAGGLLMLCHYSCRVLALSSLLVSLSAIKISGLILQSFFPIYSLALGTIFSSVKTAISQ